MPTSIGRRAVLAGVGASLAATESRASLVGKPAPPFTVTMFDHQKMTLADLAGQVIVLNYWATWCGPCQAELPMMNVYARFRRGTGLTIFAVATEDSLPQSQLKPLAMKLDFPLVTHFSGRGYGIINDELPTNYVIDRAGIVRYARAGAFEFETLDAVLVPLLQEKPPQAAAPAPT